MWTSGQSRRRAAARGRPELVGGHVALALVNTMSWRIDRERAVDRLADADALLVWSRAAGLVTTSRAAAFRAECAADPSLGTEVLGECRSVREMAYQVLQPIALGATPGGSDVQAMHAAVVNALSRAEIVALVPLRWDLELRSLRDLPTALTLTTWQLLQFENLRRLRQCRDRSCGWLFLDRSKNGSRVWCSSADCGNRMRARRHYERRHPVG